MSKKTASSTQVRINAELSTEIDSMRSNYLGMHMGRTFFVQHVIRKGLDAIKHGNPTTDSGESAFKK